VQRSTLAAFILSACLDGRRAGLRVKLFPVLLARTLLDSPQSSVQPSQSHGCQAIFGNSNPGFHKYRVRVEQSFPHLKEIGSIVMSGSFSSVRSRVPVRRALSCVAILICLLLTTVWPFISRAAWQASGQPPLKLKSERAEFVPGEILVRFRSEPDARAAEQASAALNLRAREIPLTVERFDGSELVEGLRLARVAPEATLEAVAALGEQPDVLYAEPNYIRRKDATVPNDARYAELWGLKNTGQPIYSSGNGTAGADIKAEQAWDISTGDRSIVVGIVDEGIDINHPDLKDNIWKNPGEVPGNNVDDDGNGFVDDVNGYDFFHRDASVYDGALNDNETDAHGTHVAGTVGATGNNGQGVAGVNWQVSLMSMKILGREDESPAASSVEVTVRAYSYARMMRELWISSGGTKGANIRVLNNSYGGANFSQAELDAIRALGDAGILFVVAAGNDHTDNDRFPHYPASYNVPNLISVMASNNRDSAAIFTNYGSRTVHLAAPGVDILSTTPNGSYSYNSGTSMAAPQVAGAAALICARYPGVSVERLRSALLFGGDEIVNIGGTVSGRRLSAYGSLQNLTETDTAPPATITDLHITGQTGRTIDLQWTAPGDDGATGRAAIYELRFADGNISTPAQFEGARALVAPRTGNAGAQQTATVRIPYRHLSGFIGLRAVDNVGLAGGIAQVGFAVNQDIADPYIVTESAPATLSTGGTPLNLKGDDRYHDNYTLPFNFKYYAQSYSSVTVSTNGALYFQTPPRLPYDPQNPLEDAADFNSSLARLDAYQMIAGLWDDLRTDRHATDDVYVVQPDPDRIIFRWQAVTFNSPLIGGTSRGENPVNFEIELRRDGTVQVRYGGGNQNLFPVVGVSNSEPDSYAVLSHTSEAALISLTNAQAVTFALRNPPPPPSADLEVSLAANPDPVVSGQNLTYTAIVRNTGPSDAPNVTLTDVLPSGVTFISCTSGQGTCTGPAVGTTGTVTANIGTLGSYSFNTVPVTFTVRVTAAPATNLVNTATAASTLPDPVGANNSATRITGVVQQVAFSSVKAIAVGRDYSVAVRTDGTLWAWGENLSGQLGNGTRNNTPTPAQVSGLANVVSVAASNGFTLASLADGTVWAWGFNGYGQLGDGTNTERLTPVQVGGLSNVVAVSAGSFHSVALKSDGTVWAWGAGGAVGDGTTGNRLTPVQVSGLSNVRAISAQGYHTLALKTDGTVWSWGANQNGELGDGTTTPRLTPVQVINLTGVIDISAGGSTGNEYHSLAVRSDGTVWAWGGNFHMQVGLPTADFTPHPTPAQVGGIAGAKAVSGGGLHSLALLNDGTVWAWGDNNRLQLGDNTNCCRPTPKQVAGVANVIAMAGGNSHNLVLLNDGSLRAWGVNDYGQLGDGTTTNRVSPVSVTGLASVSLPAFSPDSDLLTNTNAQEVTITCATAGAVIHYTTNGSDPAQSDAVIANGAKVRIEAGRYVTVKARAWKDGWVPSGIKAALYVVPVNPIDDAQFFVRRHYLDFLGREPDQGGLSYWSEQITGNAANAPAPCPAGDTRCLNNRRISISAAFFVENEFQRTGSFVYRFYKSSYGVRPTFQQFTSDRSLVPEGPNLEASKLAFADAWVQRAAFLQKYPQGLTGAQFVDALLLNVQQNSGVDLSAQRAGLISDYETNQSRARIVRLIADNTAFVNAEYNRAFVLMQYFGYLQRNPDDGGYNFWLGILNDRVPNNYRAMVCAFITSTEYQQRFGTTITYTNQDCGP
jgi:uncharacterized repeat protein (TIGR01451 family)